MKRHRASPRAKMERELGRRLLSGEIPVVPPSKLRLPRCPVPSTHVAEFSDVCKDYEEGRINYEDVLAKVGEKLKSEQPKQPEEGAPPT